MSDNWHGIVVNDYDCVMPVPWRKKFGIRYSYDVPFVQQLGWFQQHKAPGAGLITQSFFSFIKYGDYSFNFENSEIGSAVSCRNYILDLRRSYDAIREKFRTNLTRNFKKASQHELVYSIGECGDAIDLYRELYRERIPHVSNDDFENFRNLCKHISGNNRIIVRNVCNHKRELLAAALFLQDERRLYNIMPSTTPEGRKTSAHHYLLENALKEFAGNELLFDFEGSDIPGVKHFYEMFGAVNQPYQKLHFNHLPQVIKWTKR
jgi:hypothetical protein